MERFELLIEDFFVIKGRGIVLAGTWNGVGTFKAGETLRTEDGEEFLLRSWEAPKLIFNKKVGIHITDDLEKAKELIGKIVIK